MKGVLNRKVINATNAGYNVRFIEMRVINQGNYSCHGTVGIFIGWSWTLVELVEGEMKEEKRMNERTERRRVSAVALPNSGYEQQRNQKKIESQDLNIVMKRRRPEPSEIHQRPKRHYLQPSGLNELTKTTSSA